MVAGDVTRAQILSWLEEVKDPEVPVLSVVELGVVRDVHLTADAVTVDITPTYSGCPALDVMSAEIRKTLEGHGIGAVVVRIRFDEVWTTEWMSAAAKEKLRAYGIAPPLSVSTEDQLVPLRRRLAVSCPLCGSSDTEQKSEFGSTACKAIFVCRSCREPFDYFKAI
jgi:ring-1,2-phenylacetyl-CoA epoxidase subunit PaaD